MRQSLMLRFNPLIAALSIAFCSQADAASEPSSYRADSVLVCAGAGMCSLVQEVDETQLAATAGKFTIAGEVVGLNLVMASSWQAANGQNLEGKAMLAIRLPGSGTTQIQVGAQASGTDVASESFVIPTGSTGGGAGLRTVGGVAQLIQVAGDGNGATNRGTINVDTAPLPDIGGNGVPNASYKAANGAQVHVAIANNGAVLRIEMPNVGVLEQQVNGASSGNIQQRIQIAGNRQQVFNQLQLQVQVMPLNPAMQAAQGLTRAINMLRGR
jgi:hypothetical protein